MIKDKYEGPFLIVTNTMKDIGPISEIWHPLLHLPIEEYIKTSTDKFYVTDIDGKKLTLDDIK